MAKQQSEALKKLEDQLTCAICLNSYTDPKLLQCFHVFCKDCLTRLVVQDHQGQLSICCPNCRQPTPLRVASGVSGLQTAFRIHNLLDIQDAFKKVKEPEKVMCEKCTRTPQSATTFCRSCGQFICAQCTNIHTEWEEFSKHQVVDIEQIESEVTQLVPPKKATLYCSKHDSKELELYCETCAELICHNCTVRLHQGHKYDMVSDTFEKFKSEITESLEPVEKQLTTVNKALEQLEIRHKQINDQQAAIKDDIHRNIRQLIATLEARETELIDQVDQNTKLKTKHLTAQKDEIEMIQAQLSSCLEFVKESLRTGSQGENLKMKKLVVKQIKKMTKQFKPDTLEASELADMRFFTPINLVRACQQFGNIYTEQISPEKCHATGKGLEVAVYGEKSSVVLHTINHEGKPCDQPIKKLHCEVVSNVTAETIKCSVDKRLKNQYKISYQPNTRGKHLLHIKAEGKHVRGSPFTVVVKLPVKKLGTPIKTIGGVKAPWGVAVNKKGEIIVAENGGHCVSIFSPSGEKLQTFCAKGAAQGQLNSPYGVAVDGNDNILVTDCYNNRIQKFTSDEQLITAVIGTKGTDTLQFHHPIGIGIHPSNNKVYVADTYNDRIQVLNSDLTYSNSFGSRGTDNGQFHAPRDVAFDSTGNVYIVDGSNNRIQVFTPEGRFLRKFGRPGQSNGKIDYPIGVSIDSNDLVYVTECTNHRVSVFTSSGEFVTSFGTLGSGPGQFVYPRGIAVDSSGMVYVCDSRNNHVQCF